MITRPGADALIEAMKSAADSINADETMMHWVSRLSVFGSYLTDKPVLGDLDIAYQFAARWSHGGYEEMHRAFLVNHPPPKSIGRNFIQRMFWPERMMLRRLRVGRSISFHDHSELSILECPARLFFSYEPPT